MYPVQPAAQDDPMLDWPTGFMLIQGNRMEELRALMVAWMGRYPLNPLENEVILVQSNGIAQWLKLALASTPDGTIAGGQGIAAALDVTLPARFVWRVYRALFGELPETSPFDRGPLVWRIYRLFDRLGNPGVEQGQEPGLSALLPLRALLAQEGAGANARRRYQFAEHIADLFDQYQVYRADWLDAWSRGEDILIRANGERVPVPEDRAWQPALWRALNADISIPQRGGETTEGPSLIRASRAAIHRAFLVEAQADGGRRLRAARLPRRVIIFGICALPQQTLEVLNVLAQVSQVMLFVLNPSQHYWGDLIEGRDLFRGPYRRHRKRKLPEDLDETRLHLYGHPLLAAWGRQGRDYIRLLDAHDERERYEGHFTGLAAGRDGVDLFASPGADSLLHQLQEDILELRSLKERQDLKTSIDPQRDRSIEFIVAHSPQREIEILHDRLLAELDQAATTEHPLEPREVLVMVPDIAVYVPHIQAVFGRLDQGDRRYIPFSIADRSERRQNPLLIGLERLLNLPYARLTVSELLAWLDIPAFRARLGIDESALLILRQWITGANVRWGLDAEQRAALGFPKELAQHTWRFGLERLLLGFANGASGPWRGIEPYEAIGGLEAELLGPLAELLERLRDYWLTLAEPHPASDWVDLVGSLLDDFFVDTSEADGVTLSRVIQALDSWATDCIQGALGDEPLPLEVFRDSFLPRLDQTHLSQHFVGGAVNFATLMPMRAIPFRQIWILGLNDGDYPRQRLPSDLDLMADDYRPGDRSRRDDDRYLFLEALLSAREKLVISWVGCDIRDNSPRQPAVLVTQLRDHLAAGWRLPEGQGGTLLDALTTVYPLQPFSPSYFAPKPSPLIFTYAQEWRSAHGIGRGHEPGEISLAPWLPTAPIGLAELEAFLKSPVDALFRQRLGVHRADLARPPLDVEPFQLAGLDAWRLKEMLIAQCCTQALSQTELDACLRAGIARLQAQGELVSGPLGESMGRQIIVGFGALYESWSAALAEWPDREGRPLAIQMTSETPVGQVILEDSLYELRRGQRGIGQVLVTASKLGKQVGDRWKHTIRAWVRHLAAQLGGMPVETRLLTPEVSLTFAPLPPAEAKIRLAALLGAWWQGMQRPLPVALAAGLAWIEHGGASLAPSRGTADETQIDEAGLRAHPAWNRALELFDQDLERSSHLQRCYPDFAALWARGAFAYWAHQLYGDLYAALRAALPIRPRTGGQDQ